MKNKKLFYYFSKKGFSIDGLNEGPYKNGGDKKK